MSLPMQARAMTVAGTRVSLVSPAALDDDFLARWSRLATSALEPNPFFEPPMMLAAAEHLDPDQTLELLVAEHDDELAFLMPVRRVSRYRRIPVGAVSTWTHDHSCLGTPLLSPAAPEVTWAAVLTFVRQSRTSSWFCLEQLRADGPVARALSVACDAAGVPAITFSTSERAILERVVTRAYLGEQFSSSRLKSWRRHRRRLSEELGGPVEMTDVATGTDAELQHAVEHFLELEAAGWKGADGGAMACRSGHAAFFKALCRGLAEKGQLELLRLGYADRAIAYACNLRSGANEFGFKVAYDPDFARNSPGVLLEIDKLDALSTRSAVAHYDSCASPDNELCNRLFADRLVLADVAVSLSAGPTRWICSVVPLVLRGRERHRARRAAHRAEDAQ